MLSLGMVIPEHPFGTSLGLVTVNTLNCRRLLFWTWPLLRHCLLGLFPQMQKLNHETCTFI